MKSPLSLNQRSDEELVNYFQNHQSKEVLAILFQRHQNFIYQTCLRYLHDQAASEDALMDIFVQLDQKLSRYQIKEFKSWLFFVSRNHCYKICRNKQHLQPIDGMQEMIADHSGTDYDPESPTPIQLHKAINRLKEQQRTCIELFFFQGYSYAEIAEQVKIDIKRVKSHIQNGKLRLRKLITAA
jgi:RNA polymerase sigma-70 factor (ECF subfamily)